MLQKNELGNIIRRYLIWAEKKLHEITVAKPAPVKLMSQLELMAATVQELIRLDKELDETKDNVSSLTGRVAAIEGRLQQSDQNRDPLMVPDDITVQQLADILKDNGYETNYRKIYKWMESKGYVIKTNKGYVANKRYEELGYLVTFNNQGLTNSYVKYDNTRVFITIEGRNFLVDSFAADYPR